MSVCFNELHRSDRGIGSPRDDRQACPAPRRETGIASFDCGTSSGQRAGLSRGGDVLGHQVMAAARACFSIEAGA